MLTDDNLKAKLILQGFKGVVVKDGVLKSCKVAPKHAIIPYGIKRLSYGCLSGQDDLIDVKISSSCTIIDGAPFCNCINLKYIYCNKNLQQFESVLKCSNNAEVRYVYTN